MLSPLLFIRGTPRPSKNQLEKSVAIALLHICFKKIEEHTEKENGSTVASKLKKTSALAKKFGWVTDLR